MEHLLRYIISMCISSLMMCLPRSLVNVLIKFFFFFLLLHFKRSLYVLDYNTLSDVSFADIFSKSMSYFLILLTLYFEKKKTLILMKSSLSMISFSDCLHCCI